MPLKRAVGGRALAGVALGEPGALVGDAATAATFDGSSGAARAEVDLADTSKLMVEFWMKWAAFVEDDHLALEFTSNFNENPGGFLVDSDASAWVSARRARVTTPFFVRPSAERWHYYAVKW
jgi:hypothetical protein